MSPRIFAFPCPREIPQRLSGRSSGFRINLLIVPSQPQEASGIIQRSSPDTATGSLPIHTGFPVNDIKNLKGMRVFLLRIS